MDYSAALPDSYLLPMFEKWQQGLDRNEVVSVFCPYMSGRHYRVLNFIDWQKKQNKKVGQVIQFHPDIYSHPEDIESVFATNAKNSFPIISTAELLFENASQALLQALLFYKQKYDSPLLLFFEKSKLFLEKIPLGGIQKIIENTHYLELIPHDEAYHYFHHLKMRWNLNTNDSEFEKIYAFTGGQMWLFKEIMRNMCDRTGSLEEIFSGESIQYRSSRYWNSFEDGEQALIHQLSNNSSLVKKDSAEYQWLQKTGYFHLGEKTLPEFLTIEAQKHNHISFGLENGKIMANGICLDSNFTSKEQAFLKILLEKCGEYVARNDLAEKVWGSDTSYSDWSLDKLVSRIRKKLKALGLEPDFIKTHKHRGYSVKTV